MAGTQRQESVPVAEKRPSLLAEAETPIQVLRKGVQSGAVAKRLGIAFDAAFTSFSKKAVDEAKKYNGELRSSDPEKIRELADILETPPKYMVVSLRVNWNMAREHLKEYGPKLEAAFKEKGVDGIADVVEEAKKEGVEITIVLTTKVSVDNNYLSKLKATRNKFIENAVVMISTGVTAGGAIKEPYPLEMGDKKSAKLFMAELHDQIGANKPSDLKGVLPLEKALANKNVIPDNHYPLQFKLEKKTIIVDWAWFIGKREGVALLVPEKTPAEKMA